MRLLPNIEEFEHRAAICQFESEATKAEAEDLAAQDHGFADANGYWGWLGGFADNRETPRWLRLPGERVRSAFFFKTYGCSFLTLGPDKIATEI